MASKDDSAPGLLSRVVRFVKNPATNWSEHGDSESDRESSYSKQMLKEMIERKRRNDFVRKREFDMLRKLRRSEVLAGSDLAARPSFFQSSMPSKPDDRATTLKKIDEIEAQMSMQWWKTKHGNSTDSQRTSPGAAPLSAHVPLDQMGAAGANAYTRTEPQPLPGDPAPAAPMLPPLEFDAGQEQPARVAATPQPTPVQEPASVPASMPHSSGLSEAPSGGISTFSASRAFAIDVEEFAHDPELEEAAIRFANGDDDGAEAGLLEVLGPQGSRIDHDETWLTLFDLYRATGRQERYESAAIDFASRFGRSAPQWFSMPELVSRMSTPQAVTPPPSGPIADWNSPTIFGTQTLAAMNAALAKAQPPLRLNWSKLTSIVESAVEPLARTFTQWASQPVQLRFIGADVLEKVLKDATPSGDRSVNQAWWKLRMEVLRVMHRPDEFELVALDYCVTYEVSPPSWEGSRCEYKPLQPDGSYVPGHTIIGEAFHDSLASTNYGDTTNTLPADSKLSAVSTVELAGQILGDATEALELLESRLSGADLMVISCARLMRIDFTAAGTLLNWVMARRSEGRQVQFVEVHRLVAAFFNVIGISEHARVIVRQD